MQKTKIGARMEAVKTLGWIFGWYHKPIYDKKGKYKGERWYVPIGFEVHHIDRNPFNNSLGNLQVLSAEEHREVHDTYKYGIKGLTKLERHRLYNEKHKDEINEKNKLRMRERRAKERNGE